MSATADVKWTGMEGGDVEHVTLQFLGYQGLPESAQMNVTRTTNGYTVSLWEAPLALALEVATTHSARVAKRQHERRERLGKGGSPSEAPVAGQDRESVIADRVPLLYGVRRATNSTDRWLANKDLNAFDLRNNVLPYEAEASQARLFAEYAEPDHG